MLERFCDKVEELAGYAGRAIFCGGLVVMLLKADTVYHTVKAAFP